MELSEVFDQAQRNVAEVDNSADPQRLQDLVRETITLLLKVGQMVREAAIFSPNEAVDDINTEDLRYLLAPAYLGDLVLKLNDRETRANNLMAAQEYLKIFLAECKRLDLLTNEDLASMEGTEPDDPAEKRKLKIARYKREKQSKERMKELGEMIRLSTERNGEAERKHVLALLDVWVQRACDDLAFARQEANMLAEIERLREENDGQLPKPLPPPRGFKPFMLTRDMVKVFGAGYPSQPTMTIEEAAAREHDAGLHQCCKSHDTKMPEKELLEEDTAKGYRAQDEKTYKDRNWDAFKDENPYGAGNRYNKS